MPEVSLELTVNEKHMMQFYTSNWISETENLSVLILGTHAARCSGFIQSNLISYSREIWTKLQEIFFFNFHFSGSMSAISPFFTEVLGNIFILREKSLTELTYTCTRYDTIKLSVHGSPRPLTVYIRSNSK